MSNRTKLAGALAAIGMLSVAFPAVADDSLASELTSIVGLPFYIGDPAGGKFYCSGSYFSPCDSLASWTAPAGWDICKYSVVQYSKTGDGYWHVAATDGKVVRIHLKASAPYPTSAGSNIGVKMTKVELIPESYTDAQRKTLHCSIQNQSTDPSTAQVACVPDLDPRSKFGTAMCRDYVDDKGVRKPKGRDYACGRCIPNNTQIP